jgi:hypothetical protein
MRYRAALIAAAITGLMLAVALAAPRPQQDCATPCTYLPVVIVPLPSPTATATPEPTPIPPALSTLVIQPEDMPAGYTVDASQEVTNAESAANYLDPAAALAAFQQQGRETSWYIRYLSNSVFADVLGVSDQAIRYFTPEGADAGMDYAIADELAQFPGYGIPIIYPPIEADRSAAYVRTFTDDNGVKFRKYYFAIRKGRYVAIVQVVGLASALDRHSKAAAYAYLAAARLP